MCVWLRVGARTERLGAQSSPVVPPHGFLNTIPYSVHPPHAFTPAMKLQSSQTPHPRHFQYRSSSAPTPLRTRDVCEAWHLRSVLWYSTPRIVFSLLAFILEFIYSTFSPAMSTFANTCFLFSEFNPLLSLPRSVCREWSLMALRNSRRRVRVYILLLLHTATATTCYETTTASICNLNHVAKIFRFETLEISNGAISI